MYKRQIRARSEDFLTTRDYLWRWDTDWFWCSKNLYLQYRPLRRLVGRKRLNSITYQKVKRWNSRWRLTQTLGRLTGRQREWVIQDVDIPIEGAAEFLEFFHHEIGIQPVGICPVGHPSDDEVYPLFPMTRRSTYINFGFWDGVATTKDRPPGHFNRLVENKGNLLGGIKSLYSDAYFGEDEFWSIYDGDSYHQLKQKYDRQPLEGPISEMRAASVNPPGSTIEIKRCRHHMMSFGRTALASWLTLYRPPS